MSQIQRTLEREFRATIRARYLLFLPATYGPRGKRWPLILFLHGAGERGTDLDLLKKHGLPKIVERRPEFPFIVVSPQCPAGQWWSSDALGVLLDEVEGNFRVDCHRVYVTGLSMGGFGTWQLAIDQPDRFAAIAPICGGGNPIMVCRIVHLPVWTFHGSDDRVVPIRFSQEMVRKLRSLGGNPKFTVYRGVEHDAWTRTYESPRLYRWFLEHRK